MSTENNTILVIEDELSIRRFLKTSIANEGYLLLEAKTGQEGLNYIQNNKPDLVLLDLGLPDIDGVTVLKNIRAWTSIPIIILSARDQDSEKVKTLDAGANDYLSKPFSVIELHARIRAALRLAKRVNEHETPVFKLGFFIDLINRKVWTQDEKVQLSPVQYDLLAALVRRVNRIVTHKELLRLVWGENHAKDIEFLRIYIHQLRQKLEDDPAKPTYILTEPGIGYRIVCGI